MEEQKKQLSPRETITLPLRGRDRLRVFSKHCDITPYNGQILTRLYIRQDYSQKSVGTVLSNRYAAQRLQVS